MEVAYVQYETADAEYHQLGTRSTQLQTPSDAANRHQSFNLVIQHDSTILKNDSKSMKAMTTVTVALLPLATIAV